MPPWRIDILGNPPPDPTTSGLDRSLWELGAGLVARGHRVRIMYATPTPAVPAPYHGVEGVPIPVVSSGRRPVPQAVEVGRAAGDCVALDTQVLLGTDERAGAIKRSTRGPTPSLAMYLHSVPSDRVQNPEPDGATRRLMDRLGSWIDQRTLRRLEHDAIRRASVVLAGSSATKDRLTQQHKLPSDQVTLLPPTVPEPDHFGQRQLQLRLEHPVS
ncbi:MAG: glycosyltransferase, partial [Thermoplasmata archaeon]|nr:glycosyltransferase [Thermoplasmata archaeon]